MEILSALDYKLLCSNEIKDQGMSGSHSYPFNTVRNLHYCVYVYV